MTTESSIPNTDSQAANMDTRQLLHEVHARLAPLWPEARPLLHYRSCFELLIAVILSAQTTDEQVNAVTPELFARYPNAGSLALADIVELERIIHPVGFFHTKARHIKATAQVLERDYGGNIPKSFEALLSLPGVGRKTANLVASACHQIPGIIVDTHVLRVLFRLGISPYKKPHIMESIVRENLEPAFHTHFSHAVNRHGKHVCTARNPACMQKDGLCPLEDLCLKTGLAAP